MLNFPLKLWFQNWDYREPGYSWFVYYSTIQISFSDLKKEIGNHSVISIFHFQFENENQKIGSIFWFSFIIWNWKSENWTYFLIFILQSQKRKWKIENRLCRLY